MSGNISSHPRRGPWRVLFWLLFIPLALYLALGAYVTLTMTRPRRQFDDNNTPAKYGLRFENVTFASRGGDVQLAAWFIAEPPISGTSKRRAVILVHGKDSSRTQEFGGLGSEVAGALNKRGFAVLMLDLRGHGRSGAARFSLGLNESRDVLGAVDYLLSRGYTKGEIAVFGQSMGAAASIYAAAAEPAIGRVVSDCAFSDVRPVMAAEWHRVTGLPNIFVPATRLMSRLLLGVDMSTSQPKTVIGQLAPRPVLLIHGAEDGLVPAWHAEALKQALPSAELWIIPGARHVGGYKQNPTEFMHRVGDFLDGRSQPPSGQAAPALRLPEDARPLRYDVSLRLIPGETFFGGSVDIDTQIEKPAQVLWLNASPDLHIENVSLSVGPGWKTAALETLKVVDGGKDFIGLVREDKPFTVGTMHLRIQYRGRLLRHEGVGLFNERDGSDDYIFSDFEPFDARRAFPCFDEPSYKVPVRFTLEVPAQHLASSNAPIEREQPVGNGLKQVTFKDTPPLPTYLWAIAVGPFGVVDAGVGGQKKVPLRILTLRGQEAQGRYAAQVTAPLIDLLERYTGVPFPYDKLDQVGVPNQGHAMENPGLITYGQRLIQLGADNDTIGARRRFARVCAHELAHHWTGDLVTLRFWDELWLNESFASFLGSKITDQFKPDWGEKLDRVLRRQDAMEADSLLSARRIRQPITSNDDIVNAFDPITYAKGQSVLAMIESWLGEDVFQRGLTRFLTTHAHKTATAQDYVAALTTEIQAAGKADAATELPKVLESFLDQPGVPVVSVSLDCAAAQPVLKYRARRYLPLGSADKAASLEKPMLYRMPLCMKNEKAALPCMFLDADAGQVALAGVQKTACAPQMVQSFVQLDPEESRYARIHYEGPLLDKMVQRGYPLQPNPAVKPDTAQQLSLLLDIAALVRSSDLHSDKLLPVIGRAAAVPGRHVVSAAARITLGMRELVPIANRPQLRRFVQRSFAPRLQAIGLRARPGEDEDTSLLRATLLPLVMSEGDSALLQGEGEKLLLAWLSDRKQLDAESANALAVAVPQRAGTTLWDALYAAAKKAPDRNLRSLLLDALGTFRDPALCQKSLDLILSGEFETREAMRILWGASSHPESRQLAYDFVKRNFAALVERLPRDAGSNLPRVASGFCDDEKRAEIESFFTGRSTVYVGGPRVLKQTLERVEQCSRLRKTEAEPIANFLKAY